MLIAVFLHEVLSRKSVSSMFEFHREEDIGDSMFFEDSLEWSVWRLQFYLIKREKTKTGDKKDLAATRVAVSFIYELLKFENNLKRS